MKRITLTFLASLFLLLYIGCGSTNPEIPEATPTVAPTATQAVVPTEEPTMMPEPTSTNTPAPEVTATSTPIPAATDTPTPKPIKVPDVTMSDDLNDFTFELDGVVYQLPMTYQTFVDSGWELAQYQDCDENTEIGGYETVSIKFEKDDMRVSVGMTNWSGHVAAVKDCIIGNIDMYGAYDISFIVAKGVTFGMTKDAVKEVLGTPDSEYDQSMTYGENYDKSVQFGFYNDENVCGSISLRCYEATGEYVTVVSEERPEYLDDYVAPAELGEDITATVLALDGVLYQLPCPLSVFLENGWEIASKNINSIGAGNLYTYVATIKKGDASAEVALVNYGKKEVYLENCCVHKIKFNTNGLEKAPEDFLKLPAGITAKSTAEDVKAVSTELRENISTYSVSYIYEDISYKSGDSYRKKVYYFFSTEDEWISIEIENTAWKY